jgi:hypothetical protein
MKIGKFGRFDLRVRRKLPLAFGLMAVKRAQPRFQPGARKIATITHRHENIRRSHPRRFPFCAAVSPAALDAMRLPKWLCSASSGGASKLDILAEQRAKRNFQRAGNCRCFIIHDVARLAFDSGNGAAVEQDSLPSQPARKVVLTDWRTRLAPRLPNSAANEISLLRFSGLLHRVRVPHD